MTQTFSTFTVALKRYFYTQKKLPFSLLETKPFTPKAVESYSKHEAVVNTDERFQDDCSS